jgi:transcriptional regulator with XRE-family HTH domain
MTDETMGERIRALREERGLSQRKLAKLAGINGGYLSLIETGAREVHPSDDVIRRVALALNVDPATLDPRLGEGDGRPSWRDFVASDRRLSDDDRARVLDLVQRLRGTLD